MSTNYLKTLTKFLMYQFIACQYTNRKYILKEIYCKKTNVNVCLPWLAHNGMVTFKFEFYKILLLLQIKYGK